MDTRFVSYEFGEFTLDVVRGCVLKRGDEIKLRPKVYETLKYMVEHRGQLVGKPELMQAVWPDSFVTDDSLVQCALELRRALADCDQQLLKTVPRRGYVFTADVIPCAARKGTVTATYADSSDEPLAPNMARRNLPTPRTSLIGREKQLKETAQLLLRPEIRLLSLTGAGGAGKTRLAIAVAEAIANQFTAGVQFVALASITDPNLVASAIAETLGIQQVANRTLAQLIALQFQTSGPLLLVLDNFEQVLPAATLVAETLEACPSLKVLVTSRSCMRVYGEQEYPVTSLAGDSGVELFAQRAAAVWPGFEINPENRPIVHDICLRLDGLPLAIELAAVRTKMLSPRAILDRLQSRLQLLTGGALDLPDRQRTLRKTIDWSYDLLNAGEKMLLRRFSVFAGGCTLEAAEAVCNTHWDLGVDLFEGLASLVDKNLVQRVDRSDAEPRFAMLETIREYALERLMESGEQPCTRRAHAAYCLVLAEEGNPQLNTVDRKRWLGHCEAEVDNFRVALDWLFETRNLDWGFRLCVALFRFWDMREHLAEARSRLETILSLAGDECARHRARVLHFLGALATTQGDYAAAERFLQQSLTLYDDLGDKCGIAATLNALAVSARDWGDYAGAEKYFERSLACWRMLPDRLATARCLHNLADVLKVRGAYPRARWALQEAAEIFDQCGDCNGAAWSLNQQGDLARVQGDLISAHALYRRSLSAFEAVGDPWGCARSLTDLAEIYCAQGNHNAAARACRDALKLYAELRNRRGIARALEGSARLALAEKHLECALSLAAAAARLRKSIGAPLLQTEQSQLNHTLLPAWSSLNEEDAKHAWERGWAMSAENAVQYSLGELAAAIST